MLISCILTAITIFVMLAIGRELDARFRRGLAEHEIRDLDGEAENDLRTY